MYCSQCGKQADGAFCWNCGAKLHSNQDTNNTDAVQTQPDVKKEERELASYALFNPTKSYGVAGGTFEIDEIHQMMRFAPSFGNNSICFHYQDIIDAELVQNDSSVYKTSTTSMLTRAALGSIISGGMSIIAGSTAKKNEKKYIDSLYLRIYVKNNSVPTVKINFISGRTASDSFVGNIAMSNIEAVLGHIKQAQIEEPKESAYSHRPKIDAPKTKIINVASESPTPSKLKWRCPKCDYVNNGITCVSCGSTKPSDIAYIDSQGNKVEIKKQPNPPVVKYSKEDWYCTYCDYKNKGSVKSCSSCGRPREEEQPPKKGLLGLFKK